MPTRNISLTRAPAHLYRGAVKLGERQNTSQINQTLRRSKQMNQKSAFKIEECGPQLFKDWIGLRCLLWPDGSEHERRIEAEALFQLSGRAIVFLARSSELATIGFAEATLREDYVNGCVTAPVAFLEGIYVLPDWRRRGVARHLCGAVEEWAAGIGCFEFASDTELQNTASQRMHVALGFQETERVVFYRRQIRPFDP
jgi:aminoglycoside 6'-N-acetyltransferase I